MNFTDENETRRDREWVEQRVAAWRQRETDRKAEKEAEWLKLVSDEQPAPRREPADRENS